MQVIENLSTLTTDNAIQNKPNVQMSTAVSVDDALAIFGRRLDNAQTTGGAYRKSLYKALAVAYELYDFFENLPEEAKNACVKELKKRCVDADITYSEKSLPEHAFIRLTLGDCKTASNGHRVSQHARLLRHALVKAKVAVNDFADWLERSGGVVKVLDPNAKGASSSKKKQTALIKKTQLALKTKCVALVSSASADLTGINPVNKDTRALAVVTRHKDGSFTVNGFVPSDERLLNAAYVAIGQAA